MKYLSIRFMVGILALFSALSCYAITGAGTQSNPYKITSVADLQTISNESKAYYQLANDIINCPYIPITFCGHFDGRGHSISLNIDETDSNQENVGLFYSCSGATILNMTIKGGISISKCRYYDTGRQQYYNALGSWTEDYFLVRLRVGAICGSATSTTFKNIRNEATIKGVITKYRDWSGDYTIGNDGGMGGIVGVAQSCIFDQCCNLGPVTGSYGSGGSYSPANAGLTIITNGIGTLIGWDNNSTITNCYTTGSLYSTEYNSEYNSYYGGLIGKAESSHLSKCYYDGESGKTPFVGNNTNVVLNDCISRVKISSDYQFNYPTYRNCYIALKSGTKMQYDGVVYVEPEMLSMQSWYASNLPSWDFDNVWYMPSGSDAMPLLRKEAQITGSGYQRYGGTVEFTSTNPYSALVIEPTNDNEISIDGNRITFLKAGIISVRVHQDAVTPFKPIDGTFTCNVSKVLLTISAQDYTMSYGDEPTADNILNYKGFVGTDGPESLDKLPDVVFGGSSSSDVGKYNILVSGASSSNYLFMYNNGIQTIEPRPITVKPKDMARQYGASNSQFKLEFEGWVNGQNESMIVQYPTASTQANSKSDTGDYIITVKGGEIHPNYKFKYLTGTLTINKAPLVIGVKDVRRYINEFNPEFELTFSGFKNGDDDSSLDELPYISCEATYNSPVGVYPIVLSGGYDNNYNYDLKNGILVVEELSSIDEIEVDSEIDYIAKYYTINGLEVTPKRNESLPSGIYIKVLNNKISKIRIR